MKTENREKKINFYLDEEIHKKFKVKVAEENTNMQGKLTEFVIKYLAEK